MEESSNLIYGELGHFLVILAFVAGLVSFITYMFGTYAKEKNAWIALGRLSFLLHTVSVIGVAVLLLLMIKFHFFEFKYVWKHSSQALPMKYLFASFWEGQEGSTLLWMFWHVIIGVILIFKAKQWEAPVMMSMSLVQALLASMLLGIYILGYKFGSNPFELLRDSMNLPIFKMNPNYVPEDGTGLNPLLQNYWMTIHPPTLFLGYALCTVPFAYGLASLMTRSYNDWIKPVTPWVLAATLVLGVGILMGGAWAYEALSFGGFWAWDPVENASLVPWLMMVAGLHTMLAYKHTQYSLRATYIMFFSSFLLVLYSSYLTKSGVLGDSSVHSFTDEGMSAQLRLMIFVFIIPCIGFLIARSKELPGKKVEEDGSSREFWLFIGSIVFVLSTIYISLMTSVPVVNKVFGTNFAIGADINNIYNDRLIWVGIILGFLLGIGQYFNYKKTATERWLKALIVPVLITAGFSIWIIVAYKFHRLDYLLFTVAGVFGVVANTYYIFYKLKGKLTSYGGSLSHIGFALMMVGILISQGRQQVVSYNQFAIDYGDGFSDQEKAENILLYINESSSMNGYRITYIGDSLSSTSTFYKVRYEPLDGKGKPFVLTPNVQIDKNMGNVANPSTRRTLTSDLYTHITSAPINESGRVPDSVVIDEFILKVGDTTQLSRSAMILDGINPRAKVEGVDLAEGDLAVGAKIQFHTLDTIFQIEPVYLIQDRIARSIPVTIKEKDVTFSFTKILPETGEIEMTVTQKYPRFIIMKAIQFPMINLLWLGALIMAFGVGLSIVKAKTKKV